MISNITCLNTKSLFSKPNVCPRQPIFAGLQIDIENEKMKCRYIIT